LFRGNRGKIASRGTHARGGEGRVMSDARMPRRSGSAPLARTPRASCRSVPPEVRSGDFRAIRSATDGTPLAEVAAMNFARTLVALWVAPPLAVVVVACGGKAAATGATPDASSPDTGACINLAVTPADLACTTDDDCVFASTGRVCPGDCCGGGSVVNATAASRFATATAGLATASECGDDPCGAPFGEATCVHGLCAACETSSTNGTTCMSAEGDGGTTTTSPDGGGCSVEVLDNDARCPSTYDTTLEGDACPSVGLSCSYPGEGDVGANGCSGPGGLTCHAPGDPGTPPDAGGPTWILTQ